MAIRARSERRTETVASERGVGPVVGSYAEVLADLDVRMVYKPLPNALRGPWSLAAVRAGKQELSELIALLDDGESRDLVRVEAVIAMPEPEDFDPRWSSQPRRLEALIKALRGGNAEADRVG